MNYAVGVVAWFLMAMGTIWTMERLHPGFWHTEVNHDGPPAGVAFIMWPMILMMLAVWLSAVAAQRVAKMAIPTPRPIRAYDPALEEARREVEKIAPETVQ